MLIPAENESAESFIARARALLSDNDTHAYMDTSMAMWLTALGSNSRACFFDWAETLGDRLHVPAWTVQEFYRHHQNRTQPKNIAAKCAAVEKAIEELAAHMRIYADGPLVPGEPEVAFMAELDAAREKMLEATRYARSWDYDAAAGETIEWLNARALKTTAVFKGFSDLKRRGSERYRHDVPPGFEDGRKGKNRYGDLLFWEDVLADSLAQKAKTTVILTRDRKIDWFYSSLEAQVGPELKSLAGKWNPIPVPHPLLTLEMRSVADAELLLVDERYLGAIMWSEDRDRFGRLAAVSFGRDLEWLEAKLAPPPSVAARSAKRLPNDSVGLLQVVKMLKAVGGEIPEEAIRRVEALTGEAPAIDEALEAYTPESVSEFDVGFLAALSRHVYERAPEDPSPTRALAERLIDLIDQVPASHASAIVGGMLTAAYYREGRITRDRPAGTLLQKVLAWRYDAGIARVLERLRRQLIDASSPALWLPTADADPIIIRLETSDAVKTDPASVGQIYVGRQSVMVNAGADPEQGLRHALGGAQQATTEQIVRATAFHFGIPVDALRLADGAPDELRTIPTILGFDQFNQGRLPIRASESAAEGRIDAGVVAPDEVVQAQLDENLVEQDGADGAPPAEDPIEAEDEHDDEDTDEDEL